MVRMFRDFYTDFRLETAEDMLERLEISGSERMKSLSKGTKEKVQLALVMSRKAKLYLLDEPIGGVDPAARDFILRTILLLPIILRMRRSSCPPIDRRY